ncbi:MAG TPA: ATP synthase F1 subunit delta [Balneolaceae bacterium]|nr:ATP synthase F1 subunit delta [Balneolaceae bacterium]
MASKAAKRYANAYLETALELKVLEKAKEDMLLIQETYKSSPDLRIFLRSPVIKKDKKRAAIEAIFSDKVQDITNNLLKILSDKDREMLIEDITGFFMDLYNIHHGNIKVSVSSAYKLDKKQEKALINKLEDVSGKNVLLHTTIDESLLGGLKVRIDDTVIDGSVKYKLSQLKDKFTGAAVE